MSTTRQVQEFYSIGEVCSLNDLKPHVLRYWESQFRFLNPAKNRSGNRVYKSREVELIMLVKHLLYTEKFTIDGARQRIDQQRRNGELKGSARKAFRPRSRESTRRGRRHHRHSGRQGAAQRSSSPAAAAPAARAASRADSPALRYLVSP